MSRLPVQLPGPSCHLPCEFTCSFPSTSLFPHLGALVGVSSLMFFLTHAHDAHHRPTEAQPKSMRPSENQLPFVQAYPLLIHRLSPLSKEMETSPSPQPECCPLQSKAMEWEASDGGLNEDERGLRRDRGGVGGRWPSTPKYLSTPHRFGRSGCLIPAAPQLELRTCLLRLSGAQAWLPAQPCCK